MAVYKSKGIVLRSIRYGEADRILDLYTRDAGLISAIAKGIRRTKSRFGARLEPLSCVDFVAYHGRTLDTITQAETLRSFHGVREDLVRFETSICSVDEIVECHLTAGRPDYLLKFITRGVNHYQELVERLLERNIGIEKYFSYIVIKSQFIKAHYPIEHLLSLGP